MLKPCFCKTICRLMKFVKTAKFAKKEAFSKELQGFVEKLMAKITTDMQNKKPVNQSEFYTLTNLLKYMPDLVKIELKEQPQTPNPKTLRPTIRRFC